jgi:two-component system nitrate/nitrite response regulator NarL
MRRTRVLVADPLTIFRAGVSALLTRQTDFDVAEAASFDQVNLALDQEWPDIALIDIDLPPSGGIAAAASLAGQCPTHTIVWSFEPTRETVLAAVRAGASGYLHKQISPAGLLRSLRGIVRGEAPLARDLATLMIDAIHGLEERERTRERAAVLSPREREVLALVARGDRNKQIAAALYISEFTVKRHMQNILQKLELPSRRAAAAFHHSAFAPDEARTNGGTVTVSGQREEW